MSLKRLDSLDGARSVIRRPETVVLIHIKFVFEGKLLDLIVAVCLVEECLSQEIHILRILLVESLAECIRFFALVAYNPHTLTVIVKHR